ncbi:MAG: hypothetical protein KGI08_10875, partial [Thaumarchaeota archaeon]|nr:hypothetical protein [Nitrososphaerota archaeon]
KLDWHNHLIHEDVLNIRDMKMGSGYICDTQGNPITNELLSMCLRCKLYFNSDLPKKSKYGIVSVNTTQKEST